MSTLSNLLRENMFKPEDVPGFENKLFFEAARRRSYLERFGTLLFLATVIATVGIITDSTATVIGAMIIAPLMLPIMATAAALVMGQMNRAIQSSLLVVAGVIAVVVVSWLTATIYNDVIAFNANSQITSRTSPRLLDLVAALAAGAAGAFCMSRDDIADSLPGVAIAISLVPPLCVVGVSLSYLEWHAAWGALLLFVTNALAILLAGGGVLALLGLSRAATMELSSHSRRNAFLAIAFGALVVAIPLTITGARVTREVFTQLVTREVTQEWLAGTEFEVRAVKIAGRSAAIVITGPGEPPPFEQLLADLDATLGTELDVELEIVPSQKQFRPIVLASSP